MRLWGHDLLWMIVFVAPRCYLFTSLWITILHICVFSVCRYLPKLLHPLFLDQIVEDMLHALWNFEKNKPTILELVITVSLWLTGINWLMTIHGLGWHLAGYSISEAQFEAQFATGFSFQKIKNFNIGLLHSTTCLPWVHRWSSSHFCVPYILAISCPSLLFPKLSKVSRASILANLFS